VQTIVKNKKFSWSFFRWVGWSFRGLVVVVLNSQIKGFALNIGFIWCWQSLLCKIKWLCAYNWLVYLAWICAYNCKINPLYFSYDNHCCLYHLYIVAFVATIICQEAKIHVILRAHSISGHNQWVKSRWLIIVVALNSNMILAMLLVRKARGRTKRCWAMSLHMELCWQPNISSRSRTCINRWSRFASNGWGASLRR
jgi:hypothetical protein